METAAPAPVALEAHHCRNGVTYTVTFTGPGADAAAAEYMQARGATHAFALADEDLDWTAAPLTFAELFPSCEHGLSESLCAGPGHYPA